MLLLDGGRNRAKKCLPCRHDAVPVSLRFDGSSVQSRTAGCATLTVFATLAPRNCQRNRPVSEVDHDSEEP